MHLIDDDSKQNVDQHVQEMFWNRNLLMMFVDVEMYVLNHMNKKNKMILYVKQVQSWKDILYYILT
jgi:hypothetical protein